MSLIKKRPELHLEAEPEIVPGETTRGRVIVEVEAAVPVDWLRISLVGHESGAVGSGKNRSRRKVELCHLVYQLGGETELEPGTHTFDFAIPIPAHLPPSYEGDDAWTRYRYRVRASIPWWPDAKVDYEVKMAPNRAAAPYPGPRVVFSSREGGPEGTSPYAEISLATSVFAPGDTIRGAVALSNVDHNRYHRVLFELYTIEEVTLGRWRRGSSKRRQLRYALDVGGTGEGEQHDFNLALPSQMSVTYDSQLWTLRWFLRVRVDIRWALDLKLDVDLPVVGKRFQKTAAHRLPPAVGTPRIEAAWNQVAEATGLELVSSSLRGSYGEVSLHIYREHRGSEGLFLVGTLTYPDLHLDLEVAPGRGFLGRSARQGIQLGDDRWDLRHQVRARDPEQARQFFAPLLEGLRRIESVSMDDDSLVAEIESSGTDTRELEGFAAPLMAIAQNITRARKNLPPPAAVKEHLAVWRELARSLDGELDPGSMRVAGRFHGRPVAIETTWRPDGEPAEIAIELELGIEVDEAMRFSAVPELLMELPEALPPAARPLIESLAGVAGALRLDEDALRTSTRWLADPRHALGLVRTLSEIAGVVAPSAGPYR